MPLKHSSFFKPTEYNENNLPQREAVLDFLERIEIKPDETILDIGCGDGFLTRMMAIKASQGKVLGTDISSEMVEHANKTHNLKNLSFECMAAELNTYPNESFSLVTSFFCLQWVADQMGALQGIRRVLKSDGHAILIIPLQEQEYLNTIATMIVQPKWQELFKGYENKRQKLTTENYKELLHKAELTTTEVSEKIQKHDFKSQDKLKSFFKANLPQSKYLESHHPAEQNAFLDKMVDQYMKSRPNAPFTFELSLLEVNTKLLVMQPTSAVCKF